ncbi:MAG: PfkB family carbohydrate kinase [Deltaproteobacteria bacterium]|nr:PfkB family carbohydrate kinase [Deltaproteobacteria bacterium]
MSRDSARRPGRDRLQLVGLGSMVVDRVHRAARIVGPDEKGALLRLAGGGSVASFVGGVILNQLGWASALGVRTGIFGKQGDDEAGRVLRGAMDRAGIEHQLTLDGGASSVAEIFLDASGERAIYFDPAGTAELTAGEVRARHADFLRRGARFTTEVHQVPLAAVHEALRIAREAGLETVVDLDVPPSGAVPALGDEATLHAVLAMADLLKPGKRAARELLGTRDADPLGLARALRARFGSQAVVVTDGEIGCAVSSGEFEGIVAAPRVTVVDATGAGDAFLGGLLAGLHQGLGLADAARLGNACGAACVERLGAFPADAAWARTRALELYDGAPFVLAPPPPDPTLAEIAGAFDIALEELGALRRRLAPESYADALALIRAAEATGGRVHVTGVGKPEHLARYGASLLASTGTPAQFLHATECVHGSAGQMVAGDVVIAISNSGATGELLAAVATLKALGGRVIAITGGLDSPLAKAADVTLDAGVAREGGGLGLAPRASIAAELLVLAALSTGLETARGFTRADYHARHPGGRLGQLSKG